MEGTGEEDGIVKERAESVAHLWVCGSEPENSGWPAPCPVFSSYLLLTAVQGPEKQGGGVLL